MIASWALMLSGLLFAIGAVGALIRRHPLVVLMGVWLMMTAAVLALAAASRLHADETGHVLGVLAIVAAAAEAVVGLGLVVAIFRGRPRADVEDLGSLRW